MPREVCSRCQRPASVCACRSIEQIDNQVGITVLQHPAEHRHPLNTVRLARLGLRNVRTLVHWNIRRKPGPDPTLPAGAALLYPGDRASDLEQLPRARHPTHLVVVDGTWIQARILLAANPWLDALPRVSVSPARPSRYEDVRREPRPECMSTVEAIATALRVLEPELRGLDPMLETLEVMVRQQQRLARELRAPRYRKRSRRRAQPVPRVLVDEPDRILVAQCETFAAGQKNGTRRHEVIQIVAERLAQSERSGCFLRPTGRFPHPDHLGHIRVSREQLETGVGRDAAARWLRACLGPNGVLAAWNQRVLDLLQPLADASSTVMLKAAYCNVRRRPSGALGDVVERERLGVQANGAATRADERLSQAVAVARLLRRLSLETGAADVPCLAPTP